jgi:hypothetical protein
MVYWKRRLPFLAALQALLFLVLITPAHSRGSRGGYRGGDVSVRGYFRRDGTYVQPHMRSAPDGNFWNNWSTKGNVNPYTGQPGTKTTPPPGYGSGRSYGGSYNSPTSIVPSPAVPAPSYVQPSNALGRVPIAPSTSISFRCESRFRTDICSFKNEARHGLRVQQPG